MIRLTIYLVAMLLLASGASILQKLNPQYPKLPQLEIEKDDPLIVLKGSQLLYNQQLFTGHIIECFANGGYKSTTKYLNGSREGEALEYYVNGDPKAVRNYKNHKKEGVHLGWWENGSLKFEYHFREGLNHGSAKEWYSDGTLFRSFTYSWGKEDGPQKMFEADGSIRANYIVRNGRRYGLIGFKNCKSVQNKNEEFIAVDY